MRSTTSIVSVSVALICAVAYLLLVERTTELVRGDLSAEAKRNPYLAAGRFLTQLGFETGVALNPRELELPSSDGTVFLLAEDGELAPAELEKLSAWVVEGGHLVFSVPSEEGDPLLAGLGLETVSDPESSAEVHWPGLGHPLKVKTYSDYRIENASVLDPKFARGLALSPLHGYGEGHMSVLSEATLFSGLQLGEADHAELLYRLAAFNGGAAVFLLHRGSPGWGFLLKRAWPILLGLLGFLVLWVWSRVPRFGPLLPAMNAPRRAFLDHLDASARLQWRANAGPSLFRAARSAVAKALERLHPGLGQQVDPGRIAELTQVPVELTQTFVEGPKDRSPEEFTRAIQELERMRGLL